MLSDIAKAVATAVKGRKTLEDTVLAAWREFDQGHLQAALFELESCRKSWANMEGIGPAEQAYFLKGAILLAQIRTALHKFEEASSHINNLLDSHALAPRRDELLGSLEAVNDAMSAEAYNRKDLLPVFGRETLSLAKRLSDAGRHDRVEIVCRRALPILGGNLPLTSLLVEAMFRLKKRVKAMQILCKLLPGRAEYVLKLTARDCAWIAGGEVLSAEEVGTLHLLRGKAYLALNNIDDAVSQLKSARLYLRGNSMPDELLLTTYARLGRDKEFTDLARGLVETVQGEHLAETILEGGRTLIGKGQRSGVIQMTCGMAALFLKKHGESANFLMDALAEDASLAGECMRLINLVLLKKAPPFALVPVVVALHLLMGRPTEAFSVLSSAVEQAGSAADLQKLSAALDDIPAGYVAESAVSLLRHKIAVKSDSGQFDRQPDAVVLLAGSASRAGDSGRAIGMPGRATA